MSVINDRLVDSLVSALNEQWMNWELDKVKVQWNPGMTQGIPMTIKTKWGGAKPKKKRYPSSKGYGDYMGRRKRC